MSESKKFTMVYDEFLRMGMSWNEAGIIAYTCRALSLSEEKGVKVSEIAEHFHFCERLVRATLSKAQRLGIVKVERNEFSIMTNCELQDLTGKIWAEAKKQKPKAERKTIEERKRSERSEDRPVSEASHVEYDGAKPNEDQNFETRNYTRQEMLLQIFCDHYLEVKGTPYRPAYNITTALSGLTDNIVNDMKYYHYHDDDDTFRTCAKGWIEKAYKNSDTWKRDRWSVELCARCYSELSNANIRAKASNPKDRSEEYTEKMKDYIIEQMRTINSVTKA